MFGKMEENGVSTEHILNMRSYAHTQEKHEKKNFFIKTLQITPLGSKVK